MISFGRLPVLRRLLLGLLAFGLLGTTVELLLLHHYESVSMAIPLALNTVAMAVLALSVFLGGAGPVYMLRIVMAALIAAGGIGVVLHYQGSLAFQVEMDPTQSSWTLFTKVMTAHAPPALAPGVMAQLGLLGLIYTYQHPALVSRDSPVSTERDS
jgi:hypothetical protein